MKDKKTKKEMYIIFENSEIIGVVYKKDYEMIDYMERVISVKYGSKDSDGIREYKESYDEFGNLIKCDWHIRNDIAISAYRVDKLED